MDSNLILSALVLAFSLVGLLAFCYALSLAGFCSRMRSRRDGR